ncbi:MAG: hypothetical protein Q8R28_16395, partial [Dehalococcoidia bacterium]|nr:hypothetical protein [Dehalococcoidia bacterium]
RDTSASVLPLSLEGVGFAVGGKPLLSDITLSIQAGRRKLVAQLLLRQVTSVRELTRMLASSGEVNPATQQPWSRPVIQSDIEALDALWRRDVLKDLDSAKARILAEIREVRRLAWNSKDLKLVRGLIEDERGLLGLDAPMRIEEIVSAIGERAGLETPEEYAELMEEGLNIFRENGWHTP